MEVTRKNFRQVFEIFKQKLRAADFVSIDGEFTGLSTLRAPRFSYDTLEEKYEKAKTGADNFLIIQFGICLFTWQKDKKCYVAFPFTFCLFPRPYKRFLNDVIFTCQSSSLDFLASHGFDFNKCFYDGISFMHPTTEAKAKEKFNQTLREVVSKEERVGNNNHEINHSTLKAKVETKVFVPKDQRDFIGKIVNLVEEFLRDTSRSQCDLEPCSPFQRKLIYEVVGEKYPMGLYLQSETTDDKKKFIRVIKVTSTSSKEKSLEEQEKETNIFEDVIGFSNVMKLLSEEKKPLVGHNIFLDLFLSVTNFFAEAPENLLEFKSLITTLFPLTFDTKLMASTQPLSNHVGGTSLKQLTDCIGSGLPSIKILIDEAVDNDDKEGGIFHNAGFDAFSTGRCFISLMNCLSTYSESCVGQIDLSANFIEPFKNCIYIMGIQDIRYMHLNKSDKLPCRRGVFLVNFPSDWKETELHNLFSPICKLNFPIVWKGSTSAYVSMSDKEKHDEVISKLVMNQNNEKFQVIPLKNDSVFTSNKRKHSDSDVEDGEIVSTEEDEDTARKAKKQQLFEISKDW